MGIENVDLVTDNIEAITKFDNAIESVSSYRSKLGAVQNMP
ncbi:hypothetical protein [Oceanobacillus piezotolerans]|nr:hypothetical protein [Oceanobacillus piezotolerans]